MLGDFDEDEEADFQPDSPRTPHYFTPDPTKRFCVICGDNPLGSVWGIHRFQIQPKDKPTRHPNQTNGMPCRCEECEIDRRRLVSIE